MGEYRLTEGLRVFHDEIRRHYLGPLWDDLNTIVTKEPTTIVEPYLWKGTTLYDRVMRSGQLISPESGGERRVLFLQNPGTLKHGMVGATTHTLYAGVQLILPGEVAPTHRHSQSAVRFIMEGEGAYTVVNGEKMSMSPGDYLLTPRWAWHDHGNSGNDPVLWLDGLDAPLVRHFAASFFQPYTDHTQPLTQPDNYQARSYAGGMVRPVRHNSSGNETTETLSAYKFDVVMQTLSSMRALPVDPWDGYAVEYINPVTGTSADAHIGARFQVLPRGFQGRAHRHVMSSIYLAVKGEGETIIEGTAFRWERGDIFVVPPWAWHEHIQRGAKESILFSINDQPVVQVLGLDRMESFPDIHQTVTQQFQPD